MRSHKLKFFAVVVLLCILAFLARRGQFEVESDAGVIQDLDKINLALPLLDDLVRAHPAANSYRVRYDILPDSSHPRETLPREISFDRRAAVLRWSRELWFEQYDSVTDEALHAIAAKKGGVRMLLKRGCRRTFPKR